uniref:Uncharacterized protein n=1 Tax=Arundo donax TaxID=35708 RepID=A0A0A9CDD6_ARUDO
MYRCVGFPVAASSYSYITMYRLCAESSSATPTYSGSLAGTLEWSSHTFAGSTTNFITLPLRWLGASPSGYGYGAVLTSSASEVVDSAKLTTTSNVSATATRRWVTATGRGR